MLTQLPIFAKMEKERQDKADNLKKRVKKEELDSASKKKIKLASALVATINEESIDPDATYSTDEYLMTDEE